MLYASKFTMIPYMSDNLGDIYRTLKSRYVHEGRTINPSFYNDLSDDSVAKFAAIGICIYSDAWGLDELEKTLEQIEPYNSRLPAIDDIGNLIHQRIVHERNLKANMAEHPFDECYKLVPRKMSPLYKGNHNPKAPPKVLGMLGKAKRPQLTTSSSTELPPLDNGDFPSTKLSPRSYSRALKDDLNMSKEQRETRGMFKNLGLKHCITLQGC
ncbi:hypothetical protein Tco_1144150 [Tanacetum coccineum]